MVTSSYCGNFQLRAHLAVGLDCKLFHPVIAILVIGFIIKVEMHCNSCNRSI